LLYRIGAFAYVSYGKFGYGIGIGQGAAGGRQRASGLTASAFFPFFRFFRSFLLVLARVIRDLPVLQLDLEFPRTGGGRLLGPAAPRTPTALFF